MFQDKLSNDQKKVVLREVPSLLEMAGYTYFPTSFLVGPQFPMKKYQDFIGGKFHGVSCEYETVVTTILV